MTFASKVIQKSQKVHRCWMCCQDIPVGSIYVATPHKDKSSGEFEVIKMCAECAYLLNHITNAKFREGNFTDTNIPNFLRKIRNEYRKNPLKAWEEQHKKEQQENEQHGNVY